LIGRLTCPSHVPWYPTFIAWAFVLEVYASYDIDLRTAPRILLFVLVMAMLATLAWTAAIGRDLGGLAAGITVMAFIGASDPGRIALVLLALLLTATQAVLTRRGTLHLRLPWPRVTEALNAVLIVLLVLQVGRVAWLRVAPPKQAPAANWTVTQPGETPDIYLILADGHGRADVLRWDYGYDMTNLAATLRRLGFQEAPASQANHSSTRFSLSVLLNGRPLAELGQDMSAPIDEDVPFAALRDPSAIELLESVGYETTLVVSEFQHVAIGGSDQLIDVGPRNEIEQVLISSTPIGGVVDTLTGGYLSSVRERTLSEMDVLSSLAQSTTSRPQFVFVHLPIPHWPYAVTGDCGLRPADKYSLGSVGRDSHAGDAVSVGVARDQTRCVDSLLSAGLQDLVAARPNAVVIVLSDHGPDELLDWWSPTSSTLRDRMANLFWARTPGHPSLFPDDISLVNILPILFNGYLGTNLPLHPNDQFFGPAPNNDHFVPYTPTTP
jgi:Sulfatase